MGLKVVRISCFSPRWLLRVVIKPYFGEICRHHLQGRKISQARSELEAGSKQSLAYSVTLKMEAMYCSEASVEFDGPNGVVSQKI
jgi:hypothetical protein